MDYSGLDYGEDVNGTLVLPLTFYFVDEEEEKQLDDEENGFKLSQHRQHKKIDNPWIDKAIHGEYLERKKVSQGFENFNVFYSLGNAS